MKRKQLKAIKKWEVKTGKNSGYYAATTKKYAQSFFPEWGILQRENVTGYNIGKRHGVPDHLLILTHSRWARNVMRKEWERIQIIDFK